VAHEPRYVGGQAVIEGVMMRGESVWAVAVRTPDGQIDVSVHDVPRWSERYRHIPLVRGVTALGESMALGMRALTYAAGKATGEEEQLTKGQMTATLAAGVALFTGIFIVLPALMAKGAGRFFGGSLAFNVVEGVLRLVLFLGYIVAIGRIADIRRLFEYHGAEHKAIAAYENGVELTPERAQRFGTEHVRCGTNFLLTVMVISIVIYSGFGRPSLLVLLGSRALLIPLVAGVAYEIIRLAARNFDRPVVRLLMRPGLALQKLTTRQPSLDQLEVAIAALRAALTAGQRAEVDARVPRVAPAPGLAPAS
jgi:uncharacterized protein YqhQ